MVDLSRRAESDDLRPAPENAERAEYSAAGARGRADPGRADPGRAGRRATIAPPGGLCYASCRSEPPAPTATVAARRRPRAELTFELSR